MVVVDDDTWVRTGRAHALAGMPGIEVVGSMTHQDALEAAVWDDADVALVDAWDGRAGFDRFPGVTVVRAIRSHPRSSAITIIVATGHVVNEMLRLRMAQAGADLFYGHEEVADPESLAAAVLGAARRTPAPDAGSGAHRAPSEPAEGEPGPSPDAALDWVAAQGCDEAFDGQSQKALPLSRRAIRHIRREVSARGGLRDPEGLPSWRQVARFVNRARGADLEGPGADRRNES